MDEKVEIKGNLSDRISLVSLGKGILAGYILIIPVFAILAYIISLVKFPDKYVTGAVVVTNILSVIVAGSISSSSVRTKGWLNGATTGMVYYVILYLISSMVMHDYHFGLTALTTMITCILGGSLGGMLSIGFRRPEKHKYNHI